MVELRGNPLAQSLPRSGQEIKNEERQKSHSKEAQLQDSKDQILPLMKAGAVN